MKTKMSKKMKVTGAKKPPSGKLPPQKSKKGMSIKAKKVNLSKVKF